MVADYHLPENRQRGDEALDLLFSWVLQNGGAITGEHGVGLAKKPWIRQALGEDSLQLQRAIKQAMDKRGNLNPGKWLDL
jgi:glycolate oxidase